MPCASSSTNRAGRSWACPGHPGSPWRGSLGQARARRSFKLVADRDAGDVGVFQRPGYRFGLIAVEAGEAGPEQFSVAFGDDRLGERIGFREQAVGLIARGLDALQRFALAFERAD